MKKSKSTQIRDSILDSLRMDADACDKGHVLENAEFWEVDPDSIEVKLKNRKKYIVSITSKEE